MVYIKRLKQVEAVKDAYEELSEWNFIVCLVTPMGDRCDIIYVTYISMQEVTESSQVISDYSDGSRL